MSHSSDKDRGERNLHSKQLLRTLYLSVRTLAESFDVHRVSQEVTRTCVETFGARLAWIGRAEEDGRIVPVAWYPPDNPFPYRIRARWDDTPEGWGPSARAIRTGLPQITEDISAIPVSATCRQEALKMGFKCHAAYPLVSRGRTFGALNIYSDDAGFFTEEVHETLQALADLAATALENARLHEQIMEMNRELRAALRAREEMLRNVTHELRTPLTTIRGYLELISAGVITDPDEVRGKSRVALKHALRLQYLIDRLLLLQRLRYKHIDMSPIDVRTWLRSTLVAWGPRLEREGLHLRLHIEEEVGQVSGHPDLLQQVIDELLDNAHKFSPSGGDIVVHAWADEQFVYVSITDPGVGVPQEDLERIFDRFYQVDGSTKRAFSGMGVGLAVVREIVERHGGRVWAESPGPGKGTTIIFTLPRAST